MTTERLFTQKDIDILPDRGRFTALECIEEWNQHLLWQLEPSTDDRIAYLRRPEALRACFHECEADLQKLLPHLDGMEDCQQLTAFHNLRDALRERLG